jgi:Ni/Co efflux regulator RcnB
MKKQRRLIELGEDYRRRKLKAPWRQRYWLHALMQRRRGR